MDSLLLQTMHADMRKFNLLRSIASCYYRPLGKRVIVKRAGFVWNLNLSQLVDRTIFKRGCYEHQQLEYILRESESRRCNIFLDIGANIGLYSLFAARSGLFDKIHALEPGPENFGQLQWHIYHNNCAELVKMHQKAAGKFCGTIGFERDGAGVAHVTNSPTETQVDIATLDSLFSYRGQRITIKMDIEHHEFAALQGAENLFMNNDILLQVEIFSNNTKAINYLLECGFVMINYIQSDFYFARPQS